MKNGVDYDVCIIGGGINGAGIARDAQGRGLKTLLVEAQDLASATSSASTKLIHGGLRYLEQYDFKLVSESLKEREVLLKSAPHIIWPMRFVLPHAAHLRPYWMIQAGLFLYDRLGGRKTLPKSRPLSFSVDKEGDPLQDHIANGFCYSDCWVEDSRLVVLNAMDAEARGATIMTRTACMYLEPAADRSHWKIHLQDLSTGDQFFVTSQMVVNAAGPWVRSLLEHSALTGEEFFTPQVRLIKGSHIVIRKFYDGDHAYILQTEDGRIVFTIPYEKNYTLIGTTDVPYDGDPAQVQISQDETSYLINTVGKYFKKSVQPDDIIWSYSGVRALFDDGNHTASKVTRDYKIHLDDSHGAPVFSIFGGKITTFRKLSEEVVNRLATFLPDRALAPWTADCPLPGGNIRNADFDHFLAEQKRIYAFLPDSLILRYARAYGTLMTLLLKDKHSLNSLGRHYGLDIYEAEIRYLITHEFTKTTEDILWRRSKLGLHCEPETVRALEEDLPRLIADVKFLSIQNDLEKAGAAA